MLHPKKSEIEAENLTVSGKECPFQGVKKKINFHVGFSFEGYSCYFATMVETNFFGLVNGK